MRRRAARGKVEHTAQVQQGAELPAGRDVPVVVPEPSDEPALRRELADASERAFARLWDHKQDEVWSDYL